MNNLQFTMKLDNIVIRTGDILGHTIAAGLGIDAFINSTQRDYQMAAVEAIAFVGIEVVKYLDRRKQRVISEFCSRVPDYVAEAGRINRESQQAFERLFKRMDYQ